MNSKLLDRIRNKKIYFLGYQKFYGSSILRGHHIVNGLKKLYNIYQVDIIFSDKCIDVESLESLYGHINDSIVIMLKGNYFYLNSIDPFLEFMKKNNNIIILDLIDYIYFTKWQKLFMSIYKYDAILVQNKYIQDEILLRYSFPGICRVIKHHWDPSLKVQNYSKVPMKIVFTGLVRDHVDSKELNCNYLDELGIETVTHFDQYYPCHYNVRKNNSWQALTKSNIKLSNASACGSNIIITYDESIKELIDPSYPYLLKGDSLEETKAMIEKVKKTYQGPVWEKGLKIMEQVREMTSLNKIIPKYVELFGDLLEKN